MRIVDTGATSIHMHVSYRIRRGGGGEGGNGLHDYYKSCCSIVATFVYALIQLCVLR